MCTGSMVRPERPALSPKACLVRTGCAFRRTRKFSTSLNRAACRKILAYDVAASGDKVSNKRVFVDAGPGTPDGMRADIDGNLWCGWGMGDPELDGVVVYAPDGVLIGRIALPERCAN